jgi:hypothetical protein
MWLFQEKMLISQKDHFSIKLKQKPICNVKPRKKYFVKIVSDIFSSLIKAARCQLFQSKLASGQYFSYTLNGLSHMLETG